MAKSFLNLIGQKFGKLTVTAMGKGKSCLCDCECGTTEWTADRHSVKSGRTASCGCLRWKKANFTHGESVVGNWSPEYRAWSNMITRCHNPNATRFKDWGGRGITVFPEWRESYESFLAFVGRRPSATHSLDRWPNKDGNYAPGNVRWATREEQARNTKRNRIIEIGGESLSAIEWSERSGIRASIILERLGRGWSATDAISTPTKVNGGIHAGV